MRFASALARFASHAVLFAVVVEVCARVDDRMTFGMPLWGRADSDVLVQVDEAGITHNVPGARFEKWRINSLGFRGAELAREKPARTLRVACLGQSETFGLYESEGSEWPAQLGRRLEARRIPAEVFNASVVGPRRRDRLAYLERYVLPLAPDVVVVYPNVLTDGVLESPGGPLPSPRAAPSSPWQLRAVPKLRRRVRAWVPEALAAPIRAWRLDREVQALETARLGGRPPLDTIPQADVADFEVHLRAVVSFLRERGARPVLATYPTLVDEGNRERLRAILVAGRVWRVQLSELGMIDAARRLNQAIRSVGAELAVPVADVEAGLPRTLDAFGDHLHYTDAGAARVAAIVEETLARADLLRPAG